MPIEDISYLYEHSVKDAFMFFIDSGNRNRTFFPEPNQYVVTFEEPLKFVYGLDILDAAIPNTMYNIDTLNNELAFITLRSSADESADMAEFNNRLPMLIMEQQTNELFRESISTFMNFEAFVVTHTDWYSRPELARYLSMPALDVTEDYMTLSFIVLVSRFENAPIVKLSSIPVTVQAEALRGMRVFEFIGEAYLLPADHEAAILLANVQVDALHLVHSTSGWSMTISTNIVVPADHGGAGHVLANIDVLQSTDVPYNLLVQNTSTLEIGQYNINTLQEELQFALEPHQMYVVGTDRTESSDLNKQGRVMFINKQCPFVLNMDASSINENIGFEAYAQASNSDYAKCRFDGKKRLFASNFLNNRFQVRSPGSFNLLGTRYITLRCKEIEDHISSSVTFNSFSPGIGVFKLQDIRDVTNLRFDFSTFLRKPFHPIGKLGRLTLRFETRSGKLYDFKGFNHHILISIKYFSPDMGNARVFTKSALNPSYDPDYVRYVTNLARNAAIDVQEWDESDSQDGQSGQTQEEETDNETASTASGQGDYDKYLM